MASTQFETVREALPRFCNEVEYYAEKMVQAAAEGRSWVAYDAYIRGYCTAMVDTGQFSEAHKWAAECVERLCAAKGVTL